LNGVDLVLEGIADPALTLLTVGEVTDVIVQLSHSVRTPVVAGIGNISERRDDLRSPSWTIKFGESLGAAVAVNQVNEQDEIQRHKDHQLHLPGMQLLSMKYRLYKR
jgi:hypothetical protein